MKQKFPIFISVFFVLCGIMLGFLLGNIYKLVTDEESNKKTIDSIQHSNLLSVPEGRYILDRIIETDSTKTRFVFRLPGNAERKVVALAYKGQEWQASEIVSGDTLMLSDLWNSDNSWSRRVEKLSQENRGLGYVTTERILRKF